MTIKKTLAGIVLSIGVAEFGLGLLSGSIYAAEKTGLTDAFVQYSDIMHHTCREAHQKYPYLVWTDCGPDTKERLTNYRGAYNAQFGFLGTYLGFWELGAASSKLRKKYHKQ